MHNQNFFVASEGVLGLSANVDEVKWSWGINMPHRSKQAFDNCDVKIRLIVQDNVVPRGSPRSDASIPGKFHYFSGFPGDDSIYYERTFIGKRRLQLRVDGITSGEPVVYTNKDYFRFVTHRFMNLHSVGYILTDLAALMLLRNGYAPLHCSGFSTDKSGVLILAAPNTGKTLSAMMICIDMQANFLAEDLAITDGSTIYSVPWTSTFRYYGDVDDSRRSRWLNKATQIFPPVELLGGNQNKSIDTFVPRERMLDEAKITHVALLERGDGGIALQPAAEAIRKALVLNRYEFNYVKSPMLVAYEYFNPGIDLLTAVETERSILSQVVNNAEEVFSVSSLDATEYAPLIFDHVP